MEIADGIVTLPGVHAYAPVVWIPVANGARTCYHVPGTVFPAGEKCQELVPAMEESALESEGPRVYWLQSDILPEHLTDLYHKSAANLSSAESEKLRSYANFRMSS